jgi:hypothetical protein
MLSRYRWTWAGLAFGLVLFVFAFGDMGMGEGTLLPSAFFGAPMGIAVPLLPILFWWPLVGALLDRGKTRPAIVLLTLHTVCITIIFAVGTPLEHGEQHWHYWARMERFNPLFLWLGLAIYAIGLVRAWGLAIEQINYVPPQT